MPRYTGMAPSKLKLTALARGLPDGYYGLEVKQGRVRLVPFQKLQGKGLIEGPQIVDVPHNNPPSDAFSKEALTALCDRLMADAITDPKEINGKEGLYYAAAVKLLNKEVAGVLDGRNANPTEYVSGARILYWLYTDEKTRHLIDFDEAFNAAVNSFRWSIKKDKLDMCVFARQFVIMFGGRMFEEAKKQIEDPDLVFDISTRSILFSTIQSFIRTEEIFLKEFETLKKFVEWMNKNYTESVGSSCDDFSERNNILGLLLNLRLKSEAAVNKAIELSDLIGNRTVTYIRKSSRYDRIDELTNEQTVQLHWLALRLGYTLNAGAWLGQNQSQAALMNIIRSPNSSDQVQDIFNGFGLLNAFTQFKRDVR